MKLHPQKLSKINVKQRQKNIVETITDNRSTSGYYVLVSVGSLYTQYDVLHNSLDLCKLTKVCTRYYSLIERNR